MNIHQTRPAIAYALMAVLCSFGVSTMLMQCASKKEPDPLNGFNGFPWGTPVDSIVYVTGREPDGRHTDRIRYDRATYMGVPGYFLSYATPGGRLKSATYTKIQATKAAYDSIYAGMSRLYGKSTTDEEGAEAWTNGQSKVLIYYRKGSIIVAADRLSVR